MAEDKIHIDGKEYTSDDLTFREQRAFRALVAELSGQPDADIDELPLSDVLPALVTVLRRRDEPDYDMDSALDLKLTDLYPPEPEPAAEPEKKKRPTKRP